MKKWRTGVLAAAAAVLVPQTAERARREFFPCGRF